MRHLHRTLLRLAALSLSALLLGGCTMREVPLREMPSVAATVEPAPSFTPEPVRYRAVYRCGETVLAEELVLSRDRFTPPEAPDGVRLLGWMNEQGETVDPHDLPADGDMVFYADTRLIPDALSLRIPGDGNGLFRPASPLLRESLRSAVDMLSGGRAAVAESAEDPSPEECGGAEVYQALSFFFTDSELDAAFLSCALEPSAETVQRQELLRLLDALIPADGTDAERAPYFPDVAPDAPYYAAVCRFAEAGEKTPADLAALALDSYLWLDGALYAWDGEAHFLCDQEVDGLFFDGNGRYSSGNAELDEYVRQTVAERLDLSVSRLDNLKKLYLHVKNDFQYLVRNHHASGETGWEIDEALTLYRTGKGNCYCYTSVFWSLARGLGYNARVWSGTMGTQNQPHAWTEITLDGHVYICDPEIELNYWLLEMYTDNFMMPIEASLGWNYLAVGRN